MATSRGIDVSAYQGTQDWAAHKKDGVVFAFAKASEGQTTHDARFATHIKGIIAAGLVPGAYHFAWPNQNPTTEANNYISAVKPHAGKGFTHWLDLERYTDGRNYSGRTAAQIHAWAATWIGVVQRAFPGQRVGVYTSASDVAAGHVPAGTPLWYPAYPWGKAEYSRAEAAARPEVSGQAPLIWQFTSTPMDRSICYLSPAALRVWASGDNETTPHQEDDMQLSDQVPIPAWAKAEWPKDAGIADGKMGLGNLLGSLYSHARLARENTDALLAGLKDNTAAINRLAAAIEKKG